MAHPRQKSLVYDNWGAQSVAILPITLQRLKCHRLDP
jgi:hypothetical protein